MQMRRGTDTMHIPFRGVYPPGHPLAGVAIERGRECGCGRWFGQFVINVDWLDSLSKSQRESFLQSCEVDRKSDDSPALKAWHPQRCHPLHTEAVMRRVRRILCWFTGHRPATDPVGRPFSTRNGICQRCGKFTKRRT
jgi:hypothetical protein